MTSNLQWTPIRYHARVGDLLCSITFFAKRGAWCWWVYREDGIGDLFTTLEQGEAPSLESAQRAVAHYLVAREDKAQSQSKHALQPNREYYDACIKCGERGPHRSNAFGQPLCEACGTS